MATMVNWTSFLMSSFVYTFRKKDRLRACALKRSCVFAASSFSSRLSGQFDTYASHYLHSFMMGGRENSGKNAKCAVVAQNEISIPRRRSDSVA